MGAANTEHTDGLRTGLRVTSPTTIFNKSFAGTLSGIATRTLDDGAVEKVLVTCRHVMTGKDAGGIPPLNPLGTEDLYHFSTKISKGDPEYSCLSDTDTNYLDVAVIQLAPGVLTEFWLHDHPNHDDDREMILESVSPRIRSKDKLITLGRLSGEVEVRVTELDSDILVAGRDFDGMFRVERKNVSPSSPALGPGDSGAPLLLKVDEGKYRIMGIYVSRDENNSEHTYFCSAERAENYFDITFGNPPPVAVASARARVPISIPGTGTQDPNRSITTVTLDGSGSSDID